MNYFDPNIKSVRVLPSVCDTFLCKYSLCCLSTVCLPTLKLGVTTLSFLVTQNGSQLSTVKGVKAK